MDWKVVNPQDYLTTQEIADMLEVKQNNVHSWMERRSSTHFPEAKLTLGNTQYFQRVEVLNWFALWSKSRRNGNGKG